MPESEGLAPGTHEVAVLHPQGRIEVEVEVAEQDGEIVVRRASLVRTARKIFQGELHLPDYVFTAPAPTADPTVGTGAARAGRSRPVQLIVPTPAGGANDAIARAIAQNLGPLLGRPVVVDNRAGAHGSIASEHVARATPDGGTLLLGYVATHGMHPAMQSLGYDPVADFEPVGLVGYSPTVLVAGPTVQARTVDELATYLRRHPETYTYASAGEGTAPHFAAELFKLAAGVDIAGLTFGGSSAALSDVVAGRTQLMFSSSVHRVPVDRQRTVRALALAGSQRVAMLPGVPTLHEAGIDGVDVTQWYGVFAPAKTPADVVDSLNSALNEILTRPDSAALFNARGIDVQPGPPDQLGRLVDRELTQMEAVRRARPARLCHLLRRHALDRISRPLVVFTAEVDAAQPRRRPTPGRLHHRRVPRGHRRPEVPGRRRAGRSVHKLVLCSAKIYWELAAARDKHDLDDVAIAHRAALPPARIASCGEMLELYPNAKDRALVQEEPANQGPWPYFGLELPEKLPERLSADQPDLPPAHGRTRTGLVEGPRGRTEDRSSTRRLADVAALPLSLRLSKMGAQRLEALLQAAVRSRDGGSSDDRSLWNALRPGSSAASSRETPACWSRKH